MSDGKVLTSEMLDELEEDVARLEESKWRVEGDVCKVDPRTMRGLIDAARAVLAVSASVSAHPMGRFRGRDVVGAAWGAGPGTTPLSDPDDVPIADWLGTRAARAREQAYELVERELRGNGVVRVSLPYEGRCVLSGRAYGDAFEVSETTLLAAVDAAKKRRP
jgi:hypothetical protein